MASPRIFAATVLLAVPAAGQATFTEVANSVGLNYVTDAGPPPIEPPSNPEMNPDLGAGCAVGDYDGDGDIDVYLLGGRGFANVLYRNDLDRGVAGFTDVTATAGSGLGDVGSSRVAHFVDLDNDGDLDLVLVNDVDPEESAPIPSKVFENQGDGTFQDVSVDSGFAPVGIALCGCSLADYDQDGLLDIFVTAWAHHLGFPAPWHQWAGENRLYRNLGNMQFEDVTAAVGLAQPERFDAFTTIFADITRNGYPDLYIAIDHAEDQFYENLGGSFVLKSTEFGLTHTGNDMGLACADVDNDGDLDFYQTNITDPVNRFGTTQFNALMIQEQDAQGESSFVDKADDRFVLDTYWGWGTQFLDVDNDGDLDIAAASGFDTFVAGVAPEHPILATPSVLFENTGDATFASIAAGDFTFFPDDSRALVGFDYDRDGDQDILIVNMRQPVRLFRNDTPRTPATGHWIDVEVVQRHGNRSGIGCRVEVHTDDEVTQQQVLLAGESYLAGTPAERHFGVGEHTWIAWVRVRWEDGTATTITRVPADRKIRIEQPEHLSDWDRNGRVEYLDAIMFAWAWLLGFPRADLDGDREFALADAEVFADDWWSAQH